MAIAELPTMSDVYTRLEAELSEETLAHCIRTASVARELATIHGVDPDRAELAALLHEVADGYSDVQLLNLAEQFGIPISLTEARIPRLLHAAVGAALLHAQWGIDDDEILDAVRDHITGGVHMSPLVKIVFIADKIEPSRDRYYGGLDPVREVAKKSLDEAVLRLYAWRMDTLVASGRPVDERLVTARNRLIDRALAARR